MPEQSYPDPIDVWRRMNHAGEPVAVVGNGPLKGTGRRIDQFQLVARINHFSPDGHVGSKTDIAFVNEASIPWPTLPKDVPLVLVATHRTGLCNFVDRHDGEVFRLGENAVDGMRRTMGVSPDRHLLTGVIAAFAFLTEGWQVHLFGFDFFRHGIAYHRDFCQTDGQLNFMGNHDLEREEQYLRSQPRVVIH